MTFRMPDDTSRTTVIGKTGSGKTQASIWHLGQRSITTRPWVLLDFKRDELIADLPKLEEIGLNDKAPRHPGLYVVRPNPDQHEAVDEFLWRIWARENTGLYLDEGYMVPTRSAALQALLTQGRSKHIPMIICTQRPVWLTRFAFSEADYLQLFKVTDSRDLATVKSFMPLPVEKRLPTYHSWWWDNGREYKSILKPVPDRDTILTVYHKRLVRPKKVF